MDKKILSNSLLGEVTSWMQMLEKFSMLPQCARQLGARLLKTGAFIYCSAAALPAQAIDVEIRVSDQVAATADFRPGKTGMPAVLVLHGFLQTREFGIVKSLSDSLADAGYTVLSPNLSLGISYRKSSLDCEALHLHDMEGDIREIDQWVQWLRKRGYPRIVGLGHSFGATQLLAWKEKHADRQFSLIGVSMVGSTPFAPAPSYPLAQKISSKKTIRDAGLAQAPLAFCGTYTAPVGKYASYYKWNEKRILDALQNTSARADVILGSEDKYLPQGWGAQLRRRGARIHRIEGASHFMDGTQEFDLFDITLDILKR